ncbi:MAG: hypothetical protein HY289_07510 [Planctomycetes bacterium]|nr:hypothetical protein [Planctomycetota bacterium]
MKTIETTQTAGADKLLHLTIPVDEANRPYRMVIVLVPESELQTNCAENGWPAGYFGRTYGSIQDESFVRQPQGDYPERLELE